VALGLLCGWLVLATVGVRAAGEDALRYEVSTELTVEGTDQRYEFASTVLVCAQGIRVTRYNQEIIVDLGAERICLVDLERGTYRALTAEKLRRELTRERGEGFLQRLPEEFELRRGSGRRRVAGLECVEYELTSMGSTTRFWVSEEPPWPEPVRRTLAEVGRRFGAKAIFGTLVPAAGEWSIPGLALETETEVGAIRYRARVTRLELVAAGDDPLALDPAWSEER
jgi:hypothetical protein